MIDIPTVPIGPHGLSEIVYMGHTAPLSPLCTCAKKSATYHYRMLVVEDIDKNKFADAWFDGTEEELPLAEQWLLDMCNVLYGGET